jgi:DNA-binding CsgD family transcriptional regulator
MESRQVSLGVWNRQMLWGERLPTMYRSAYWHDLLLPNRAFDTLGITLATDRKGGIANFQFYHAQQHGRRFGLQGIGKLRAVFPAFAAGVRSRLALEAHYGELGRFVDAIPTALAIATMEGVVLHRNAALEQLLSQDPHRLHLIQEMARAIRHFGHLLMERSVLSKTGTEPAWPKQAAPSKSADYRVSVCALGAHLVGRASAVGVVVERIGKPLFPSTLLKQRYRLSERELHVARLLAEGKTNKEISVALGVSPFTARHHTERILLKMGLTSRAKVGPAITMFASS